MLTLSFKTEQAYIIGMSNVYFPQMQYVNVKVKGIEWDATDEDGEVIPLPDLPIDIDSYEVELDDGVDVHERWREDGGMTGFDELCEMLVDQLSCEYGFCINGIDEIEVLVG